MTTQKTEALGQDQGGNVDEVLEEQPSVQGEVSQEKPSYEALEALLQQAESNRKKLEEDGRSQRIQLLTQKQRDEKLDMLLQLQEEILAKSDQGILTRAEAKAELRKGIAEIEEQVGNPSDQESLADGFKALFKAVNEIKGLPGEELQETRQWYEKGRQAFQAGKGEVAKAYLSSAQTAFDLVKLRNSRPGAAALTLNSRGGQRSAGETDQQWFNRYADEVNGGIPGTPENAERARALRAKGLVAQKR